VKKEGMKMIKFIIIVLLIGGLFSKLDKLEEKCNKIIDNIESKRRKKLMNEIEKSSK